MKNKILKKLPKNIILRSIRVYQKTLSFDHAIWASPQHFRVCIHHPSCSEYTYQAIDRYGLNKGGLLGLKRVLKCNIFFKGGFDPVP